MASRSSYSRTLNKLQGNESKPLAMLTAWRGRLFDEQGKSLPANIRIKRNEEANKRLEMNLRKRGFSYYPTIGAGQESDEDGNISMNKEDSFLIQPENQMDNEEFLNHIRELIWNPAMEPGPGPYQHTQWGAVVQLVGSEPSLIHHKGSMPFGPESYSNFNPIGKARPTRQNDTFYTQMKKGPKGTSFDPSDPADHRRFTMGN